MVKCCDSREVIGDESADTLVFKHLTQENFSMTHATIVTRNIFALLVTAILFWGLTSLGVRYLL
jgi:hypothetical protein